MPKDGKGVVKAMYFHEQSFHQKYGDGLNQFIEKENPDLILVDAEQLTALAEKGKLLPLDAVLKQERFDTAGIPFLTVDFFRQLGGGHIYALSPTYNVEAIYYNVDLSREHGIEPPLNQMTWEELFELASRFGQLGNSPTSSKSLQGNSTFEVGIVTMPVNPANPGVSPFMSFNEMFAINSNSANKRIAWELLSYMCSPEMAKTLVSGYSLRLPIRNEGIAEIGGLPAEPFTMLKPYAGGGPGRNVLERVKASPEFNAQIYQTMNQTLICIVKEDKPVDEALAAMQKELQERLELEKKKIIPEAPCLNTNAVNS
ncbi:extracellular solute-binding protein [Paenibacillus dendritiformis]|nr:extracellular solute-binding protein [Paenibacillus dendritiformis]CAH8768660.1 extracellular solute-binding protein [Paenibacillus dendritiformis]